MSEWPDIPYSKWERTGASLHMWCQIVGQISFGANSMDQPLLAGGINPPTTEATLGVPPCIQIGQRCYEHESKLLRPFLCSKASEVK